MLNKRLILVAIAIIFHLSNAKQADAKSVQLNQTITRWNYGSYIRPANKSVEFGLDFFSPTIPGNYEVIIFQGGFDGIIPGFFYEDICTQLALATNRIVVFLSRLSFIKVPSKEEVLLETTLNWVVPQLTELFNDPKTTPDAIRNKVFPSIKPNGISLMSHSSSGHSVCSYMNKTCGFVKTLILLDPVDGYDPFNIFKLYITNPPAQLPFTIPTLIISNGLDAKPANPLFPSCAPNNISNLRFYESLPGPTILLNFTSYGHADILDEWMRKFASLLCHACIDNCNYPLYKHNIVKAIDAFLLAVENKDEKYIDILENPSESEWFDSDIKITSIQKYNGYDITKTGAFCNHRQN